MGWLVVRTEPRRERVAQTFIKMQDNEREIYFPMFRDPHTSLIVPLFPGYLFVFNLDGAWHWIQRTFGVVCLVMRGGKPDIMRDSAMLALRENEREGLIDLNQFRKGDPVNFVRCAFTGLSGTFIAMSAKDRCNVMLEMLGQHVQVTVPTGNLIRASAV